MNNLERRKKLLTLLQQADAPICGKQLSKDLNVTRQIIVSDIAILRSSGISIASSKLGYMIIRPDYQNFYRRSLGCQHKKMDAAEIESEMNVVVDNGGIIHQMILQSKTYGTLCVHLNIRSRRDVKTFIQSFKETDAPFITVITRGEHLLEIETHDAEEMQAIKSRLDELDLLKEDAESALESEHELEPCSPV